MAMHQSKASQTRTHTETTALIFRVLTGLEHREWDDTIQVFSWR